MLNILHASGWLPYLISNKMRLALLSRCGERAWILVRTEICFAANFGIFCQYRNALLACELYTFQCINVLLACELYTFECINVLLACELYTFQCNNVNLKITFSYGIRR